MKHVHPTSMVAHLWANQAQSDARNPGRNFYFDGRNIYSYGSHFCIASFQTLNGSPVLLMNSSSYSKTTAKHVSEVRHALTRAQLRDALYVPKLNSALASGRPDAWRDLGKNSKDTGIELCVSLQKRVKTELAAYDYAEALKHFENASRFYTAGGARAEAKAFMPTDADRPAPDADRATIKALAQKWANVKMRADMASAYEVAKDTHARIVHDLGAELADYEIGNLANAQERAERLIYTAKLTRAVLKLAPSRAYAALKKAIDATKPRVASLVDAAKERGAFDDYTRNLANYWREVAKARRADGCSRGARSFATKCAEYHACDPRIARIAEARSLRDTIESVEHGRIQTSEDFARGIRFLTQTLTRGSLSGNLLRYVTALRNKWEEQRAPLAAAEAAKRAGAVRAWLAGESGVRASHDWPTMARIRGDVVETTRGATVPLEHAQRLVRIVRRTMERGGAVFAPGEGPTVGHFRVNLVESSGRIVIGCHEFGEPETSRLMALIEASETVKA